MKEIPFMEEPARYEARAFQDADFVEVASDDRIDVKMQYPILGMNNAEETCLMRREVAERLYLAASALPEGYRFRVWDAWRPFALQQELYEVYSRDVIRDFHLEKVSEEERNAVIRGFISEPNPDREIPPVHTTGGAVDLTILDPEGNELDMGTGFDAFTEKTRTDYFESAREALPKASPCERTEGDNASEKKDEGYWAKVRDNRRLLYHVMIQAGFTNLPSEWWHYDYGDRFWAYYNGKPAIYGGVFAKEEINGWRKYC